MTPSPDSATLAPVSQGVRRSRRLAAKGVGAPIPATEGPAPAEACVPPTPCLNASPNRFDGPPPTWMDGSDTTLEQASPPEPPALTQAPRAVRTVEPSVLDDMPSSSHLAGLAIHMGHSSKHARHRSESHGPKAASSASIQSSPPLSSSISSPRLGTEDWPLDEPLAKSVSPPATPLVGSIESGVFPTSEFPEPPFPMVAQDCPEAAVPSRSLPLSMERSVTMCRELPLNASSLPREPGVVGLGIDMPHTDRAVEQVSTKLSSLAVDQAPRKALADRANAPVRVPLGEKSKVPARPALGDQGLGKGTAPPLKAHYNMTHTNERLDENGQPWAGSHVPTKRSGLAAPKKVRSAGAQGSQDGVALLVSHSAGRGAPSLQVHTRPMYTLR